MATAQLSDDALLNAREIVDAVILAANDVMGLSQTECNEFATYIYEPGTTIYRIIEGLLEAVCTWLAVPPLRVKASGAQTYFPAGMRLMKNCKEVRLRVLALEKSVVPVGVMRTVDPLVRMLAIVPLGVDVPRAGLVLREWCIATSDYRAAAAQGGSEAAALDSLYRERVVALRPVVRPAPPLPAKAPIVTFEENSVPRPSAEADRQPMSLLTPGPAEVPTEIPAPEMVVEADERRAAPPTPEVSLPPCELEAYPPLNEELEMFVPLANDVGADVEEKVGGTNGADAHSMPSGLPPGTALEPQDATPVASRMMSPPTATQSAAHSTSPAARRPPRMVLSPPRQDHTPARPPHTQTCTNATPGAMLSPTPLPNPAVQSPTPVPHSLPPPQPHVQPAEAHADGGPITVPRTWVTLMGLDPYAHLFASVPGVEHVLTVDDRAVHALPVGARRKLLAYASGQLRPPHP
eukprot:TRINITY_DN9319_c0_g1_i1.p1 TRINITY_DN9319_c0_g1~~TRINITY_DN9319_c0_g1_i1.p1  ORF type:complete len:464 (+),score=51.51 TRINITY_DN9319_c0_g1_i1:75-1466(+)